MTEIQADYNYIMRAIDGCETSFQTRCCEHMIQFFDVQHKATDMADCLRDMLQAKAPPPASLVEEWGAAKRIPVGAKVFELQENGVAVRIQ